MRIALPISAHDAHMLPLNLELLRHFGNLENHSISFSPSHSASLIAQDAAEQLREICPDVSVLEIDFEGQGKWPQSPNQHWAMTMMALAEGGNTQPIFWMEQDCTPKTKTWADDIDHGWRAGRKAFLGSVRPKPTTLPNGSIIFEPDDFFLMGCCVYPPNLLQQQHAHTYLKALLSGAHPEAWDFYLRGWMRQLGWTDSPLIADRWNTMNYRYDESGNLVCDPRPSDVPHQDYANSDVSKAVVIHGCKDQSLAQLILSGVKPVAVPQRVQQPASPPAAQPAYLASPGEIAEIRSELARHSQMLEKLCDFVDRIDKAAEEAKRARVEQETTEEAPPVEIETIRGILADQKLQLEPLAEMVKMEPEALREMLSHPDSRVTVKKGWCILQAA